MLRCNNYFDRIVLLFKGTGTNIEEIMYLSQLAKDHNRRFNEP